MECTKCGYTTETQQLGPIYGEKGHFFVNEELCSVCAWKIAPELSADEFALMLQRHGYPLDEKMIKYERLGKTSGIFSDSLVEMCPDNERRVATMESLEEVVINAYQSIFGIGEENKMLSHTKEVRELEEKDQEQALLEQKERDAAHLQRVLEDLQNRFTYHPPKGDQAERYHEIRNAGFELAKLLVRCCPDSRERSLAITALEDCIMRANRAIAINE